MAEFDLMETKERHNQLSPLFQVQKLKLNHRANARINQIACLFQECQLIWAHPPGSEISLCMWTIRTSKAIISFPNSARAAIVKERREARLPKVTHNESEIA